MSSLPGLQILIYLPYEIVNLEQLVIEKRQKAGGMFGYLGISFTFR